MASKPRTLIMSICAALAGHALLLQVLPASGLAVAKPAAPAAISMQTRSLQLPDPPAPTPVAQAPEPAKARPVIQPRPAPKPKPPPAEPAEPTPTIRPVELKAPAPDVLDTQPPALQEPEEPAVLESQSEPVVTAQATQPPPPQAPAEAGPEQDQAAVAGEASTEQESTQPVLVQFPDGRPWPQDKRLPVQFPDPALLSFTVTGQAKGFNYSASAQLLWQPGNGRYLARQEIKAFLLGSRSQTSEGLLTRQGLAPTRFADKGRREQAAHFEFEQGRVRFSANTPDASIAAGAQDRLSVFLQLAALMAAAPQDYPAGTQISFTTVSAKSASRWAFKVGGLELLNLPMDNLQALRLDKLPGEKNDQKASLWLAPSLQYLPARIRLEQSNGDWVDLQLQDHEQP
ncbi:DUF3108 domain-containing protein [Comamonas composti]|uniref:DUF3108 domain-containing protein n=1 Tax=Comamonas composti TaxID=408558 RepID=UPI000479D9F4|nr:DUF3108 domain-containing protein [Comamonas composti]